MVRWMKTSLWIAMAVLFMGSAGFSRADDTGKLSVVATLEKKDGRNFARFILKPPADGGDLGGPDRNAFVLLAFDINAVDPSIGRAKLKASVGSLDVSRFGVGVSGGGGSWTVSRVYTANPSAIHILVGNVPKDGEAKRGSLSAEAPLTVEVPLATGDDDANPTAQVRYATDRKQLDRAAGTDVVIGTKVPSGSKAGSVTFAIDQLSPTALTLGDRATLSWNITKGVSATLSTPAHADEQELITLKTNGDYPMESGQLVIRVVGRATYVLEAKVPDASGEFITVRKEITVDIRGAEQFGGLNLVPSTVLPGGPVEVAWAVRGLDDDGRNVARLVWTDQNGYRRVQLLDARGGLGNGERFVIIAPAGDQAPVDAGDVRLEIGRESVLKRYDIARWKRVENVFGDTDDRARAVYLESVRGLSIADGKLAACGAHGIRIAKLAGSGDGNEDGMDGRLIGTFEKPDRLKDGVPVQGGEKKEFDYADDPCLAITDIGGWYFAAIVEHATGPIYERLLIVFDADGRMLKGSESLTKTVESNITGSSESMNYDSITNRAGKLIYDDALVAVAPQESNGRHGKYRLYLRFAKSAATFAFSRTLDDQSDWREPFIEEPRIKQLVGVNWRLIKGVALEIVGTRRRVRDHLYALSDWGALLRFTPSATASIGSVDFPQVPTYLDETAGRGQSVAGASPNGNPAQLGSPWSLIDQQPDRKDDGPAKDAVLVDVGGVLVLLGGETMVGGRNVDYSYNPRTNGWNRCGHGLTLKRGVDVAVYQGGVTQRLWAIKQGELFTLAVNTPQMFAGDFFGQQSDPVPPVTLSKAVFKIASREDIAIKTNNVGWTDVTVQSYPETKTMTVQYREDQHTTILIRSPSDEEILAEIKYNGARKNWTISSRQAAIGRNMSIEQIRN